MEGRLLKSNPEDRSVRLEPFETLGKDVSEKVVEAAVVLLKKLAELGDNLRSNKATKERRNDTDEEVLLGSVEAKDGPRGDPARFAISPVDVAENPCSAKTSSAASRTWRCFSVNSGSGDLNPASGDFIGTLRCDGRSEVRSSRLGRVGRFASCQQPRGTREHPQPGS